MHTLTCCVVGWDKADRRGTFSEVYLDGTSIKYLSQNDRYFMPFKTFGKNLNNHCLSFISWLTLTFFIYNSGSKGMWQYRIDYSTLLYYSNLNIFIRGYPEMTGAQDIVNPGLGHWRPIRRMLKMASAKRRLTL